MSNDIQWERIEHPSTFQSLVNTLVFYLEKDVFLFNAPAADGGQDAAAEDGKIIFQAKFHKSYTPRQIIVDAEKELKNIKKYKAEGHKNKTLWKKAEQWVLVTNVPKNRKIIEEWQKGIIPEFKKIGLKAELWSQEDLEAKLVKYPEIIRNYFYGENRLFVSLAEKRYQLIDEEVLEESTLNKLINRKEEKKKFLHFLSDDSKKIFVVSGAIGTGKTRFLYEAGKLALEENFKNPNTSKYSMKQVFWGNVKSLEESQTWFTSIIPEIETLLILDMPTSPSFIGILSEQIKSKINKWKIVVAVRSSNIEMLDALESSFNTYKTTQEKIELKPLVKEDAFELFQTVLGEERAKELKIHNEINKEQIEDLLKKECDYLPLFISAVAKIIREQKGSVVDKFKTPLKNYKKEVIREEDGISSEFFNDLISWIAIYNQIDINEDEMLSFLQLQAGAKNFSTLKKAIKKLIDRKVLKNYGLNKRYIKIIPSWLRDYILREWLPIYGEEKIVKPLLQMMSETSDESTKVVLPYPETVIETVAYFHQIQKETSEVKNNAPDFISDLSDELIQKIQSVSNAQEEETLVKWAKKLSAANRSLFAEVVYTVLNKENVKDSPIIFDYKKTHQQVVASLAKSLYEISTESYDHDIQTKNIEAMIELARYEDKYFDDELKNRRELDARGPFRLLSLMFEGFSLKSEKLREVVKNLTDQKIEEMKNDSSMPEVDLKIAKAILLPQLKVHKEENYWGKNKIFLQPSVLCYHDPLVTRRRKIFNQIFELIETPKNNKEFSKTREFCWYFIREFYDESLRASRRQDLNPASEESASKYSEELKETLEKILDLLKSESSQIISEIELIRKIWDWNLKYGEGEIQKIAKECEDFTNKLLLDDDLEIFASDVYDLFRSTPQQLEKDAEKGVKILLNKKSPEEITDYFQKAIPLVIHRHQDQLFSRILFKLGESYPKNDVLKRYVEKQLTSEPDQNSLPFRISVDICDGYFQKLRTENKNEFESFLQEVYEKIPAERKLLFFRRLYIGSANQNSLIEEDLKFFLSHISKVKLPNDQFASVFQILGKMYFLNSEQVQSKVDQLWSEDKIPLSKRLKCFQMFLKEVWLQAKNFNLKVTLEKFQKEWLFNQILYLPDIDDIGRNDYYLESLFKDFQVSIEWFKEFIQRRINLYEKDQKKEDIWVRLLPFSTSFDLLKFIPTINEKSSEDEKKRAENICRKLINDYNEEKRDEYSSITDSLPQYLTHLYRQKIPDIIVEKIEHLPSKGLTKSSLLNLSRYAGQYSDDSDSTEYPLWEKIAHIACKKAKNLLPTERNAIYRSLISSNSESWSSTPGELDPRWERAVEEAKRRLDQEDDQLIRDFRRWYLGICEERLESEREELEEETEE